MIAPPISNNTTRNSDSSPEALQLWMERTATRDIDTRFLPKSLFSLPKSLSKPLANLLGINALLPVNASIAPDLSPKEFAQKGLDALGVTIETDGFFEEMVPRHGSLIVVANHPFGGIDGMALIAKLLELRPDTKFLVNVALGIFSDLRQCCLPLDVLSGDKTSMGLNMASLRLANAHLQKGGAVVFFPSGTVSHWQWGKGVTDPQWQITPARFAIRHQSPVLPIFFHGSNSFSFNAIGMLHPLLRTLLLPREMLKSRGRTIKMTAGRLIDPSTLKVLGQPEAITAYFRMRCYALETEKTQAAPLEAQRSMEPVAEPHAPEALAQQFAGLPPECLLLQEGNYAVYCIKSGQSPLLLEELGSLRESTFRLVGEGSGKSRDLDIYDARYYHMLLWNKKDQCLVGAYRLGKVQEILCSHGASSLYTASLFHMNKKFFRRYANSVELGRALVHPRYQREYAPLMLLWKGIGRFVNLHEDVHCLFGPVSLSLDYAPVSLRTAVEYLKEQCGNAELAKLVRGRYFPDKLFSPAKEFPLPEHIGYNDLVTLVRDIEGGRGIPILFKHYLKLGGKIGAFHMDATFNTLDAFLLMDLVDSPRFMLERYMGKEAAATFLARWTMQANDDDV